MSSDPTTHPSVQLVAALYGVRAQWHPLRVAQEGGRAAQHKSEVIGQAVHPNPSCTDVPGSKENYAVRTTLEVALQALVQVDGTRANVFTCGSTVYGDDGNPLGAGGAALDLSTRREVEQMLIAARGYAAAIEQSRRQLRSTLNMVLDLIQIESARPGSDGHVAPD